MVQQPEESPGLLLWHVSLRWQRAVTAALKPLGLTHVQFVLLASAWWLNAQDEQPNQAVLSAFAGTDVKMTSQVIRTLEQKGLITRAVDAADTRARRIVITDAGAALAPRAIDSVEAVDAALLNELSKTSAHAFTNALRQLRHRGSRGSTS
jgi:DNA-binding MarR family transcriptional regulator